MGWGRSFFWSFIAAFGGILFLQFTSVPQPHLPTSDIYTHLSVARHLAQGDGFVTDITYPLSFAYPFAQELPQPLIHRQPGYAILLQIPYATAGGDSHLTLNHVRIMQLTIVGLIIMVGAIGYLRRGTWPTVLPWLVFLLANPLFGFAVNWGFVELVCSLVLFVIWLRSRDGRAVDIGPIDGLLTGVLAMLRLDLFWVPWLWFIWLGRDREKAKPGSTFSYGKLIGAVLTFVLVMTPWAIRNIQLSGQPFFSLQAQAELVKMTPAWPDYSVYKQLEPQPIFQTILQQPIDVLNKVKHGLWFFLKEHHRLMPRLLFGTGALAAICLGIQLLWTKFSVILKLKLNPPLNKQPEMLYHKANMVAFASLALLCLQYSFFDHDLRHLLVLLPIILWEINLMAVKLTGQITRRYKLLLFEKSTPIQSGILGLVAALVVVLLFPCQLPGWQNAVQEAKNQESMVAQKVSRVLANPETVLFDETSAVPWFVNQPAVWSPANEEIRNRIKEMLSQK